MGAVIQVGTTLAAETAAVPEKLGRLWRYWKNWVGHGDTGRLRRSEDAIGEVGCLTVPPAFAAA